ncbi:MAG: hypothetical protein ABIJ00_16040 [Candidatus Eisenbacteria bacterium]
MLREITTCPGTRLRIIALFVLLLAALLSLPACAEIQPASGDLLDEIESIRTNMPGRDTEGFTPPEGGDLDIWRTIVEALLDEQAGTVDSLITIHFPEYELLLYVDTGLDSSEYYLLKEATPVTLGWGTLILRICHAREIAVEVPHPRYEINTPSGGGDIFRRVGARLFIMAGTHRCANSAHSPCDGTSTVCGDNNYHVSDMAHLTDALFQVAHEAFTAMYMEGYSFSMHGTGSSSCEDIFLSNGHASDSRPVLYDLRDHMLASGDISIGIAGDGMSGCTLHGSTNTQGRYTNGSPDPCIEGCASTTGCFIHAEQQRRVRDSLAVYSKLIDAIQEVIPAVQAGMVPAIQPMTGLVLSGPYPNPGKSQIRFALTVTHAQAVKVEALDTLGRRVDLLYDATAAPGRPLQIEFNTAGLAGGIYFVRASSWRSASTRMVTILR